MTKTDEPLPEPPSWLPPLAAQRFHEVVTFLRTARAFQASDVPTIIRLSLAWHRWCEAEKRIATGEEPEYLVTSGRYGDRTAPGPARRAASEASKELSKLERQLGLDPAARSAIRMPPAEESFDDWAAALAAAPPVTPPNR